MALTACHHSRRCCPANPQRLPVKTSPRASPAAPRTALFDVFAQLGASEEQLDFPVLYASARQGWAATALPPPGSGPPAPEAASMAPLLDALLAHVPPPPAERVQGGHACVCVHVCRLGVLVPASCRANTLPRHPYPARLLHALLRCATRPLLADSSSGLCVVLHWIPQIPSASWWSWRSGTPSWAAWPRGECTAARWQWGTASRCCGATVSAPSVLFLQFAVLMAPSHFVVLVAAGMAGKPGGAACRLQQAATLPCHSPACSHWPAAVADSPLHCVCVRLPPPPTCLPGGQQEGFKVTKLMKRSGTATGGLPRLVGGAALALVAHRHTALQSTPVSFPYPHAFMESHTPGIRNPSTCMDGPLSTHTCVSDPTSSCPPCSGGGESGGRRHRFPGGRPSCAHCRHSGGAGGGRCSSARWADRGAAAVLAARALHQCRFPLQVSAGAGCASSACREMLC
jgi:hypothetical protein